MKKMKGWGSVAKRRDYMRRRKIPPKKQRSKKTNQNIGGVRGRWVDPGCGPEAFLVGWDRLASFPLLFLGTGAAAEVSSASVYGTANPLTLREIGAGQILVATAAYQTHPQKRKKEPSFAELLLAKDKRHTILFLRPFGHGYKIDIIVKKSS